MYYIIIKCIHEERCVVCVFLVVEIIRLKRLGTAASHIAGRDLVRWTWSWIHSGFHDHSVSRHPHLIDACSPDERVIATAFRPQTSSSLCDGFIMRTRTYTLLPAVFVASICFSWWLIAISSGVESPWKNAARSRHFLINEGQRLSEGYHSLRTSVCVYGFIFKRFILLLACQYESPQEETWQNKRETEGECRLRGLIKFGKQNC